MRWLLTPFSIIYGIIVRLRHLAYDRGIFRSENPTIPTIVIGNLSVGGTGKTPHTMLLGDLLGSHYEIAFLSRGYGRKGNNYHEVSKTDAIEMTGDEPMLFKQHFPDFPVAVCGNRLQGINHLINDHPELDLILLDDAYQHRKLKPGFSILLIDYMSLLKPRLLLPAGNERDVWERRKKADILLVTRFPLRATIQDQEKMIKVLKPGSEQSVFFTSLKYTSLQSFDGINFPLPASLSGKNILLITGIANTKDLVEYLEASANSVKHFKFADHHSYTKNDILAIEREFSKNSPENSLILTTGKDRVKLFPLLLPENYKNWYEVKIELRMSESEQFEEIITTYVGTAKRNRPVYPGKNL